MPDDDDEGWGGTADLGWANSDKSAEPGLSPLGPGPKPGPPTAGPQVPPQRGNPRRTPLLVGAAAVLVLAVVAVIIVVSTSGKSSPTAHKSPSVAPSNTPISLVPTPAATTLLAVAPFGSDCTAAVKSSYNTSSVVDQIVCVGSQVTATVSAAGVSYAKFPTMAALQSWYTDTILKANGVTPNAGVCATETMVSTTRSASYCEGSFTDHAGAADARQLLVQAPATIELSNGPNSTAADCPGSDFTALAFTSPADLVGVIAVSCTAISSVANVFESALMSGAFALKD